MVAGTGGGGGGDITNSTTVTKPASGSVTANSYLKLNENYVQLPISSYTYITNPKFTFQLTGSRFLLMANTGSSTDWLLQLSEKSGFDFSVITTISTGAYLYSSCNFIQEDSENFTVFYNDGQSYIKYFRFSLVGNILTITQQPTGLNPATKAYDYNNGQCDVVKLDTDKYLHIAPYYNNNARIIDTSSNTVIVSTTWSSGYTYLTGGCKIIDYDTTKALILYGRQSNLYGAIGRLDIDLTNNTLSFTTLFQPSNTNILPRLDYSNYVLSFVKSMGNYTYFLIIGLYVIKLVFASDYSSVTATRPSNIGTYAHAWYYDLGNNKVLAMMTYGNTKWAIVYTFNSDGTVSTQTVQATQQTTQAGMETVIILTDDNTRYIAPTIYGDNNSYPRKAWTVDVNNGVPTWYSGVAMLSSNSDTIYGVSKNSASDGENVQVMIPDVT